MPTPMRSSPRLLLADAKCRRRRRWRKGSRGPASVEQTPHPRRQGAANGGTAIGGSVIWYGPISCLRNWTSVPPVKFPISWKKLSCKFLAKPGGWRRRFSRPKSSGIGHGLICCFVTRKLSCAWYRNRQPAISSIMSKSGSVGRCSWRMTAWTRMSFRSLKNPWP